MAGFGDMSRVELLGYLALSFMPLAAISVVCGVGAVVAIEFYSVRLLWTLWLLVATTTLYLYYLSLYYWQPIVPGRFTFMNLMSDGVFLPPVATAIVTHLLHRFGVRRTFTILVASATFGALVYSISYVSTV